MRRIPAGLGDRPESFFFMWSELAQDAVHDPVGGCGAYSVAGAD